MKMKSAKLMTLMTAVALGVFSGGNVMAAGNGDFYMQPPADSGRQIRKGLMQVTQMAVII